jgi:hypothetical protein
MLTEKGKKLAKKLTKAGSDIGALARVLVDHLREDPVYFERHRDVPNQYFLVREALEGVLYSRKGGLRIRRSRPVPKHRTHVKNWAFSFLGVCAWGWSPWGAIWGDTVRVESRYGEETVDFLMDALLIFFHLAGLTRGLDSTLNRWGKVLPI